MTETTAQNKRATARAANPLSTALGWTNRYVGTQNLGLLIALAILVMIIGSQKGEIFFTSRNLLNIGAAVALIGVASIAQTIVMLSGGLDVAIASTVGLTSVA